jgi:DNA-binding beta-propeller fold protein YncE
VNRATVCVALLALSFVTHETRDQQPLAASLPGATLSAGELVGYQPMPAEICVWPAGVELAQAGQSPASPAAAAHTKPLRTIRDPYSSFSAVAVDAVRNEVYVADESLLQILVYRRLDNTPDVAEMTQPIRTLGGSNTDIEFICGLYVDQKNGEVYGINNDGSTSVVFSREHRGNVPPARKLQTPHGTFGIAAEEESQELYLTIQHDSAVVVFRKSAAEGEEPLRLLQGDRTRLADPHGIAVDRKNDLIFVTNHGSVADRSTGGDTRGRGRVALKTNWPLGRSQAVPGSGRFLGPSITVHSRTAAGNTPPLRVIQGPRTQLNWPAGIVVDEKRGELFVASDMGHSILVFPVDAEGDVPPVRVLKGPGTGLKHPTGLFLDTVNDELWVANFGNHSLTVHKPSAGGNTPPLRTIRGAPKGSEALMIGNPGGLAFDTKRGEILTPN